MSSSFSHCTGLIRNPEGNILQQSSTFLVRLLITDASFIDAEEKFVGFLLVTLLTPSFGWKSRNCNTKCLRTQDGCSHDELKVIELIYWELKKMAETLRRRQESWPLSWLNSWGIQNHVQRIHKHFRFLMFLLKLGCEHWYPGIIQLFTGFKSLRSNWLSRKRFQRDEVKEHGFQNSSLWAKDVLSVGPGVQQITEAFGIDNLIKQ